MPKDRREFIKVAGATAAVAGAALAVAPAAAQTATPGQFRAIKALAFDAYGTLFDAHVVRGSFTPGSNKVLRLSRTRSCQ
jgi:cytosine/adenosine deaminase-related metal-dependent hydrolase